jgi:acyl carrier protein
MKNLQALQQVIVDVFLLDPAEYRLDLRREEVDTWDSFGVVSLSVGIQEVFGYHFTPEEAMGIRSVQDIIRLLSSKGIDFEH